MTTAHGRILERVGADIVVYPEHEMGRRVAHLVGRQHHRLVPARCQLRHGGDGGARSLARAARLAELELRAHYGVTVVCVKPGDEGFTYATADTVLEEGDVLVVAGPSKECEAFARLS